MRKQSTSRRLPSPLQPAHLERVTAGTSGPSDANRILTFADSGPSDANRLIERHELPPNQGG